MRYRAEIDGLRALAVLPVILFHGGFESFSGGYVGVDVFFVVSGYLITGIILADREAGRFSLARFYERRARRILPALFVVMFATVPVAWMWMLPGQLKNLAQSLVAVPLFTSNVLFWWESGYFEPLAELKPLLHTWSLAVEEQFYLLFPVALLAVVRFGRAVAVSALVAAGAASLAFAEWAIAEQPSAGFYLLPSRLFELLIGAFVAVTTRTAPTATGYRAEVLAALGLALVVSAVFVFDRETPWPGILTLVPTVGTALLLAFATGATRIGRLLGVKVLVGVGLVSYSAYLWHQPLFAFARVRSLHEPGPVLMLALGAAALALAWLTWWLVERPFRDRARVTGRRALTAGVGCATVLLALGMAGHLAGGFPGRTMADGTPYSESDLEARLRLSDGLDRSCRDGFTPTATCRTSPDPTLVLWGDSFAMQLVPALLASGTDPRLVQMTKAACGPIPGLAPLDRSYAAGWAERCLAFNDRVMTWLAETEGITHVVVASAFVQYVDPARELLTRDGRVPTGQAIVRRYLAETLDALVARGLVPVVVAPPPARGEDLGACLARATRFGAPLEECDFPLEARDAHRPEVAELVKWLESRYRVIRPGDATCDEVRCRASVDGVFLYADDDHLSREGSAWLGREMGLHRRVLDADLPGGAARR